MSDSEYRNRLREWVDKSGEGMRSDDATWQSFSQGIHYLSADFHDPATYSELNKVLAGWDTARATGGNRIFYLSTAPGEYVEIIQNLGAAGMARDNSEDSGWSASSSKSPSAGTSHRL